MRAHDWKNTLPVTTIYIFLFLVFAVIPCSLWLLSIHILSNNVNAMYHVNPVYLLSMSLFSQKEVLAGACIYTYCI